MTRLVECFFDVGSPAAYLAWMQLPKIVADAGGTLLWRPILLGGIFKATGNSSPVTIPAKAKWLMADLARFATRYGVPFQTPVGFPLNTLSLMRGAVGLQMQDQEAFTRYVSLVFSGIFSQGLVMSDPTVLAKVLGDAGFDLAAFDAMTSDPTVKQALVAGTDEAVARGVFGAPTMFVGETMHFGQDRLDFIAAELRR